MNILGHNSNETWVVISMSIIACVLGIIIGEATVSLERVAILSGQLVTVLAVIIGIEVIRIAIRRRNILLFIAIISIWTANLAFSLSILDEPLEDMLFDIATFMSLAVIFKHANDYVDRINLLKFGRRQSDRNICNSCNKPCTKYGFSPICMKEGNR
jgi:hypothetical protein